MGVSGGGQIGWWLLRSTREERGWEGREEQILVQSSGRGRVTTSHAYISSESRKGGIEGGGGSEWWMENGGWWLDEVESLVDGGTCLA